MRKLLLAVGDAGLKTATLDFACYLARLTGSSLTGVFLEGRKGEDLMGTGTREDMPSIQTLKSSSAEGSAAVHSSCEKKIEQFKDACTSRDVIGHVHRDHGLHWKDLLTECRYADAIIVDADFSIKPEVGSPSPSPDVRRLLHESECPVIISPPGFEPVEEIIMAYDAGLSSVYAIRQFIHLFPEYSDMKAIVLEIRETDDKSFEEKYRLREWLKNYFKHVEFVLLNGDPENRLLEYLLSHQNAFVVLGGYGRDRLSRVLRPSTSATMVKVLAAPIFITHR